MLVDLPRNQKVVGWMWIFKKNERIPYMCCTSSKIQSHLSWRLSMYPNYCVSLIVLFSVYA